MNTELWNNILSFDFDSPPGEYSFSIRLANENNWSKNFTTKVILEYKKFMYLAATSDFMVSPSEIVDTVWHQHLIFTQSYQDLCAVLAKQIQHVPSTHNKDEFQKFKQAKERTQKLYAETFGEQPKEIWDASSMYESLNLDKANLKIRTFVIIGILSFIALITPFYFLLKPLYVTIDNPYFIIGFSILVLLTFLLLEIINRVQLKRIIAGFDKNSFIYDLQPQELVYIKSQKLSNVINDSLNELIENNTINVYGDDTLQMSGFGSANSIEQLQIANEINNAEKITYNSLVYRLSMKPVFRNVANFATALKKYISKSQKFGKLFYINFIVLAILLMSGFIRLTTGLLREKPVAQISLAVIITTFLIIGYLMRLTNLIFSNTIPGLYRKHIIPGIKKESNSQWNYFLFGNDALSPLLVVLVNNAITNGGNTSSSNGSCGSSGGSCGSSCGSSCGGCGGD